MDNGTWDFAGALDEEIRVLREENRRLRKVLKACRSLISTGVLGRVLGLKPISKNAEHEINSCVDKINAALKESNKTI